MSKLVVISRLGGGPKLKGVWAIPIGKTSPQSNEADHKNVGVEIAWRAQGQLGGGGGQRQVDEQERSNKRRLSLSVSSVPFLLIIRS